MDEELRHPVALTRRYHLDLCVLDGGLCTGASGDGFRARSACAEPARPTAADPVVPSLPSLSGVGVLRADSPSRAARRPWPTAVRSHRPALSCRRRRFLATRPAPSRPPRRAPRRSHAHRAAPAGRRTARGPAAPPSAPLPGRPCDDQSSLPPAERPSRGRRPGRPRTPRAAALGWGLLAVAGLGPLLAACGDSGGGGDARVEDTQAGTAGAVIRPISEKRGLTGDLKLRYVAGTGPGDVQNKLLSGALDVASMGPIGAAVSLAAGADVLIFSTSLANHVRWLVPENSPYRSVADLRGKKVATRRRTATPTARPNSPAR
ncbi:PhnD/SsuA/transferrin family substrate-binding protein [Streptomyces sp. M19]